MAQLFEYVDYLSREIGARPAGTEEEQQAALYIAEQFQKDAGFHTEIEEFTSSSNIEGANAILGVIVIVASILAMLFNMLAIPAFILILVSAIIYILEAFDHPFVSKALSRGASQNVISKYKPGGHESAASRGRARKVVLVAHYDSGKVKPALVSRLESINAPLGLICVCGMAAAAFFMLLRIFFGTAGGLGIILLNVLTIASLIIVALPVVKTLLYRVAPYNEGANNNATGVAALLEVARRVSQGSVSEADLAQSGDEVTMHGEEAVLESGLVPDGVDFNYEETGAAPSEAEEVDEFENYSEEERLLAAKAAIAALTGRPVENRVYSAPESHAEYDFGEYGQEEGEYPVIEPLDAADAIGGFVPATTAGVSTIASQAEESGDVGGFQNAPSWFIAAQKNAKKNDDSPVQVQRSRYSSAMEHAEHERKERERARIAQEQEQQRILLEQQRQAEAAARAEAVAAQVPSVVEAPPVVEEPVEAVEIPLIAEEPKPEIPEIEQAVSISADQNKLPNDDSTDEAVETIAADEVDEPSNQESEASAASLDLPKVDLGSTIAFDPRLLNIDTAALAEEAMRDEAGNGANIAQEVEAEVAEESEVAEDSLPKRAAMIENLPAIDQAPASSVPAQSNPSRSGMFRKLRTDVPSMSGVIRMQEAGLDTSQPAPVPVVKRVRPQVPAVEVVEQPADVDYEMELPLSDELGQQVIAESAAPAVAATPSVAAAPVEEAASEEMEVPAPNKVDMPKSRAGGFFGRLRRKGGNDLEETPQEWLDVDDDFNAREVGRKRGSWESFKNESGHAPSDKWEGGAFSRVRLGHVSTLSGENTDSDVPDELIEATEDRILNDEIEQIIHFRNPSINTEVWFVAIGSDTELHDGAKAFIEEHRAELRGSMIVELESLGAGVLSVASEEGRFRPVKTSSRMKRFTRGATEATGIALDQVKLNGTDSIASTMQRNGFQSMHLMGAEDGRPALKGSADDVIENVDELILEENVDFVMELLKNA